MYAGDVWQFDGPPDSTLSYGKAGTTVPAGQVCARQVSFNRPQTASGATCSQPKRFEEDAS